jgi:O-antigen/teichoic acid export membrane protein
MAFSVTTITSKLIIAAGEERVMSRILVVFTISQILFLYLASQVWGLMGVVLVYVAHEALYAIVLSGVAFRRLNHWDVVRGYMLVLLSALASLGLTLLIPDFNPLVSISLQTIFFGMMLFATRVLRIDHITRLRDVILRRQTE